MIGLHMWAHIWLVCTIALLLYRKRYVPWNDALEYSLKWAFVASAAVVLIIELVAFGLTGESF